MKKIFKNTLIIGGLLGLGYISVTADYSSLTKNTGDTLTAASWNQLVDNVKGIQTDSSGNIGIEGSLSTSSIIRVNQSATSEYSRIGFGPDNNDMIFSDNSVARSYGGGLFFRVHDENTLHDYRDVMVMTDQGKVGIGSTDPQSRLHVHEKQNYGGQIRLSNTNTDANWNIGIPGTAGSSEFMIYDYDQLSTRFLIDDDGRVGIGKSNPTMNLDVEGNTRFGNESRGIYMSILGGNGSPYGSSIGFNSYRDAAKASNILVSSTGSSNIKGSSSINFDGLNNNMIFSFHKKANGLVQEDYNLVTGARMFIQGDTGRIGIGTTNPNGMLNIAAAGDLEVGSIDHGLTVGHHTSLNIGIDNNEILARNNGAHADLYIQGSSSTADTLVNSMGGNVGIGITGPDAKLQVQELNPAKSIFSMVGDGGKCYFQVKLTCSSGWTQIGADDNQKLCMECND